MLCLERTDTRFVTIQLCQNYTTTTATNNNEYNAPQLAQLWNPFVSYDMTKQQNINTNLANDGITISNTSYPTFTITPGILLAQDMDTTTTTTTNNNNSTTTTWCLTNQHHPKSEEIVALKPCRISNQYDTGFWNIYPLP